MLYNSNTRYFEKHKQELESINIYYMVYIGGIDMALDMNKYIKIRGAQAKGVRTIDELKATTDIAIDNEEELKEMEALLKNVCKCKKVSIDSVVEAVKAGNDTVEKVGEATNAGTVCGRCTGIILNIIENKR